MGLRIDPRMMEAGTWMEPEEFCYPHGRMTRRGRALDPSGRLVTISCGIPDSFFTIPARGGYLDCKDGALYYHPRA